MKSVMTTMMVNKKGVIKGFFIGILFLIIYNAPFIHNRFTSVRNWSVYTEHYKQHNVILDKHNEATKHLIAELSNKKITEKEFLVSLKTLNENKKNDLKNYFKKKKSISKEFSFMGYSSFRYFLYAIGMPIFAVFTSILLLIFLLNPNHLREFKKFYILAIIGLIYVSIFWVLQSILVKTDFKQWTYTASFGLLAVIPTILIPLFVILLSKKEHKLRKGIKLLIDFISIDLYYKRIKKKEQKEVLIETLKKYDQLKNVIK